MEMQVFLSFGEGSIVLCFLAHRDAARIFTTTERAIVVEWGGGLQGFLSGERGRSRFYFLLERGQYLVLLSGCCQNLDSIDK